MPLAAGPTTHRMIRLCVHWTGTIGGHGHADFEGDQRVIPRHMHALAFNAMFCRKGGSRRGWAPSLTVRRYHVPVSTTGSVSAPGRRQRHCLIFSLSFAWSTSKSAPAMMRRSQPWPHRSYGPSCCNACRIYFQCFVSQTDMRHGRAFSSVHSLGNCLPSFFRRVAWRFDSVGRRRHYAEYLVERDRPLGVLTCGQPRSIPLRSTEPSLRLSRPCRVPIAHARSWRIAVGHRARRDGT